jgi:adenosylcobyric acid synthase
MEQEKQTVQRRGTCLVDVSPKAITKGQVVWGYEIHMGKTTLEEGAEPFIALSKGTLDGAVNEDRTVFGTYLHGIFDAPSFRQALLAPIRQEKGLEQGESVSYETMKETAYDHLAQVVRDSIDLEAMMDILDCQE